VTGSFEQHSSISKPSWFDALEFYSPIELRSSTATPLSVGVALGPLHVRLSMHQPQDTNDNQIHGHEII
jgi:hypothetical protein